MTEHLTYPKLFLQIREHNTKSDQNKVYKELGIYYSLGNNHNYQRKHGVVRSTRSQAQLQLGNKI